MHKKPYGLFVNCPANQAALIAREYESYQTLLNAPQISTLFITGNPTADDLARILQMNAENTAYEVTLEITTPCEIDFAAIKKLGINRLSFKRGASADTVAAAAQHIDNISLDLGQSDTLPDSLLAALSHIAIYESNQFDESGYWAKENTLKGHGFTRYDLYHFAQPGKQSIHQLGYLSGAPYLGLGPGACGRLILEEQLHDQQNLEDAKAWQEAVEDNGKGPQHLIPQTEEDMLFEAIHADLSRPDGVKLSLIPYVTAEKIAKLQDNDLIELSATHLRLHTNGFFKSHSVAAALLS